MCSIPLTRTANGTNKTCTQKAIRTYLATTDPKVGPEFTKKEKRIIHPTARQRETAEMNLSLLAVVVVWQYNYIITPCWVCRIFSL